MLKELGYELIPVDVPSHCFDDIPTVVMIRSILILIYSFYREPISGVLQFEVLQ